MLEMHGYIEQKKISQLIISRNINLKHKLMLPVNVYNIAPYPFSVSST